MTKAFFEILRPGVNTTFQDQGRKDLYHIGIPMSGAIDQRNHKLANKLVNNDLKDAVIEFAYQGPLLKLKNGEINFAITGDVFFNIIREGSKIEEGKCYKSYFLKDGDQIDIVSSKDSVYGYLSIEGGFEIEKTWGSFSINTKAEIGPNNGKKFFINEKIYLKNKNFNTALNKKMDYKNIFDGIIRVIKSTNYDYFSNEAKSIFFSQDYLVTKLADRMGMRLDGPSLQNIVSTNIKSEGLIKGVIQIPADGKPIILLSDHGTIGGYPKIATVISADLDKVGQLIPGKKINFKEVNLAEAEKAFNEYDKETNRYLNELN